MSVLHIFAVMPLNSFLCCLIFWFNTIWLAAHYETALTYSMVQSPSWEANWFAASQEIPRISRNP